MHYISTHTIENVQKVYEFKQNRHVSRLRVDFVLKIDQLCVRGSVLKAQNTAELNF
jgi:hypothetical protein